MKLKILLLVVVFTAFLVNCKKVQPPEYIDWKFITVKKADIPSFRTDPDFSGAY